MRVKLPEGRSVSDGHECDSRILDGLKEKL
jgi:hypothetical protein